MLIPDTKLFLISGKMSVNKLNPWETVAWAHTQLFLHMPSQGRNTIITGTENHVFSSYSLNWQHVSFPKLSALVERCLQALVIRQRRSKFFFLKHNATKLTWLYKTKGDVITSLGRDLESSLSVYYRFVSVITGHPAGPVGSKCSFCTSQSGFD